MSHVTDANIQCPSNSYDESMNTIAASDVQGNDEDVEDTSNAYSPYVIHWAVENIAPFLFVADIGDSFNGAEALEVECDELLPENVRSAEMDDEQLIVMPPRLFESPIFIDPSLTPQDRNPLIDDHFPSTPTFFPQATLVIEPFSPIPLLPPGAFNAGAEDILNAYTFTHPSPYFVNSPRFSPCSPEATVTSGADCTYNPPTTALVYRLYDSYPIFASRYLEGTMTPTYNPMSPERPTSPYSPATPTYLLSQTQNCTDHSPMYNPQSPEMTNDPHSPISHSQPPYFANCSPKYNPPSPSPQGSPMLEFLNNPYSPSTLSLPANLTNSSPMYAPQSPQGSPRSETPNILYSPRTPIYQPQSPYSAQSSPFFVPRSPEGNFDSDVIDDPISFPINHFLD